MVESNIAINKNLELSKTEHFTLQVGNEAINTTEESHSAKSCFPENSSHQSQQNYSK